MDSVERGGKLLYACENKDSLISQGLLHWKKEEQNGFTNESIIDWFMNKMTHLWLEYWFTEREKQISVMTKSIQLWPKFWFAEREERLLVMNKMTH